MLSSFNPWSASLGFWEAGSSWNDKISIELLTNINRYLILAIADDVGIKKGIVDGTRYCRSTDVSKPACAGITSPQAVENYYNYAERNNFVELMTMCYLYAYFQLLIDKYFSQSKNYITIGWLEVPFLREKIRKALDYIIKIGTLMNKNINIAEFIELDNIPGEIKLSKDSLEERPREQEETRKMILNSYFPGKEDPLIKELKQHPMFKEKARLETERAEKEQDRVKKQLMAAAKKTDFGREKSKKQKRTKKIMKSIKKMR